jgi:hypothetical protein
MLGVQEDQHCVLRSISLSMKSSLSISLVIDRATRNPLAIRKYQGKKFWEALHADTILERELQSPEVVASEPAVGAT